ncbi:DUF1127 domain-containing protein [Oceanibium sediminis]|uniref:DUF1127 domain-containing protein n=1 Tax=Oceanibium sediminis TaxID=2026339 RepID=UPI000DD2E2ED|nr:DUF1127 domain-containing protein [Oceanibium sediminis]
MHPVLSHRDYVKKRNLETVTATTRRKTGSWLSRAFQRWQRGRLVAVLSAMDDRLLQDIGIERADIPRRADELTRRDLNLAPEAPAQLRPVVRDARYDAAFRDAA